MGEAEVEATAEMTEEREDLGRVTLEAGVGGLEGVASAGKRGRGRKGKGQEQLAFKRRERRKRKLTRLVGRRLILG